MLRLPSRLRCLSRSLCASASPPAPLPPAPLRRGDYTPPAFLVPRMSLEFDLDPSSTTVRSRLHLSRAPLGSGDLVLDGIERYVSLQSLRLGGCPDGPADRVLSASDYVQEAERLVIPARLLPPGDADFVLEADVELCPKENLSMAGLYMDGGGSFMTQCEAEGFRQITFGLDRPDVLTVFQVRLTADRKACPVLLSNGNLVGEGEGEGAADHSNSRHSTFWEDPFPKPSYLFAVVAGDLGRLESTFTTMSGADVDLAIYSEPKNVGSLVRGRIRGRTEEKMREEDLLYACVWRREERE